MAFFRQLFGFNELESVDPSMSAYEYVQSRFKLSNQDRCITSLVNNRSFLAGEFSGMSLEQLEAHVYRSKKHPSVSPFKPAKFSFQCGAITVSHMATADVMALHAVPGNHRALFQAASQFNALEFRDETLTPEDGISIYQDDPTQGPRCAIACAAATLYRNYFLKFRDGTRGQTTARQLDNLEGIQNLLGQKNQFWTNQNGYIFASSEQLQALGQVLETHDRREVMKKLQISVVYDAEVTWWIIYERTHPYPHRIFISIHCSHSKGLFQMMPEPTNGQPQLASQVYCSAISCAYSKMPVALWEPFASLILDACYEATLWTAVLNARRSGCNKVFLTWVGGGAFGNDNAWILAAIARALVRVSAAVDDELQVYLVHYRAIDRSLVTRLQAALAAARAEAVVMPKASSASASATTGGGSAEAYPAASSAAALEGADELSEVPLMRRMSKKAFWKSIGRKFSNSMKSHVDSLNSSMAELARKETWVSVREDIKSGSETAWKSVKSKEDWVGDNGAFGKESWAGQRGLFGVETRGKVKDGLQKVKKKMSAKSVKEHPVPDVPEAHLLGSHERTLPRVDSADL